MKRVLADRGRLYKTISNGINDQTDEPTSSADPPLPYALHIASDLRFHGPQRSYSRTFMTFIYFYTVRSVL